MKEKHNISRNIIIALGMVILIAFKYILHHKCFFVMDDLWYGTNLVTGKPLQSFSDIIQSQIWHFFNWGGRNITHGVLQLTLMNGEIFANILNIIMALILALMICIVSGYKNPLAFILSSSLIIALNPNIQNSMFWQSGTVNYVYSTAWILLFLWVYLRETTETTVKKLPLIPAWIIPLGVITGWSNENMGPASVVISIAVILYLWKFLKRTPPVWMYLGAVSSFLGSALVILAPGNFVRTAEIPETSFLITISERFLSMLRAGADYLFPSVAFMLVAIFIYVTILKKKLKPFHWLLLAHALLSYGAMALSPHYPDRATFGTMCVCITLALSLLKEITQQTREYEKYLNLLTLSVWSYAVYTLILIINSL